jgi:hypothetical protein
MALPRLVSSSTAGPCLCVTSHRSALDEFCSVVRVPTASPEVISLVTLNTSIGDARHSITRRVPNIKETSEEEITPPDEAAVRHEAVMNNVRRESSTRRPDLGRKHFAACRCLFLGQGNSQPRNAITVLGDCHHRPGSGALSALVCGANQSSAWPRQPRRH